MKLIEKIELSFIAALGLSDATALVVTLAMITIGTLNKGF